MVQIPWLRPFLGCSPLRDAMKDRTWLGKCAALTALFLAASASHVGAQDRSVPTRRAGSTPVFGYAVGDQVISKANPPSTNSQVMSSPFLYLEGAFGGRWQIDGYGSGSSAVSVNQITIQHNETIALDFEGFGPMLKTSGSSSGLQTMDWNIAVEVYSSGGGVLPGSTGGLVVPTFLNTSFTPGSPLYTPGVTGGVLYLHVKRQAIVHAAHEPGQYENQGSITLYRY